MVFFLSIINGVSFIAYGLLCLLTDHMVEEFTRYGLLRFRRLTGVLELLGGLGCLLGYFYYRPVFIFANMGLGVLMILGVVVRARIKDPWHQILPAAVLGGVSFSLVYFSA